MSVIMFIERMKSIVKEIDLIGLGGREPYCVRRSDKASPIWSRIRLIRDKYLQEEDPYKVPLLNYKE